MDQSSVQKVPLYSNSTASSVPKTAAAIRLPEASSISEVSLASSLKTGGSITSVVGGEDKRKSQQN